MTEAANAIGAGAADVAHNLDNLLTTVAVDAALARPSGWGSWAGWLFCASRSPPRSCLTFSPA